MLIIAIISLPSLTAFISTALATNLSKKSAQKNFSLRKVCFFNIQCLPLRIQEKIYS
jgi:hypothetical protein